MQKALAFILAIVLTLGLAACSGDEREPNSPEPGTVWDAGQDSGKKGKKDKCPIQVDFASLSAINPDIVGWVYIEDTGVNYPVVQGEDNEYYLHHTFEGRENFSGAIFMDTTCSPDFSSDNSILFGHNLKTGEMFGALKKLYDTEYNAEADWTKHPDKYPGLCTPDESYHGVTYTERFGLAGAYITKATVQLMRDLGAIQSPQSAYYLNLGLESLHVRMKRHCENAQRVAEFLQQHENVSWVQYCGLPGDKYYELGQKYLPHGSCGVVSFGVKGGRAAAEAVMGRLKIASIETHVADSHTCCLHPASTTHRQMNAEELLAAGVREDLIRYSCGLEDAEDLIADLDQALQ